MKPLATAAMPAFGDTEATYNGKVWALSNPTLLASALAIGNGMVSW